MRQRGGRYAEKQEKSAANAALFFMKSDGALGENQSKGGPLSLLTLQGHLGAQICGAVLDNGQSQSRSSGGMALVRPIEPFKHPALDLLGDPMPVSSTITRALLPVSSTVTHTLPPGRLYTTALSQRL